MNKKLFEGIIVTAAVFGVLLFSWEKEPAKEIPQETDTQAKWQEAEHTPYGKYPETITYIFRQETPMKTTAIHVI